MEEGWTEGFRGEQAQETVNGRIQVVVFWLFWGNSLILLYESFHNKMCGENCHQMHMFQEMFSYLPKKKKVNCLCTPFPHGHSCHRVVNIEIPDVVTLGQ